MSTNRRRALVLGAAALPLLIAGCAGPSGRGRDRDDNPPGSWGGPGTNWENPPGSRGGPGASPDRRSYRGDRDDNPPGSWGGPGTNWENPPGRRGGPGASPDRRRNSNWW